MFYFRDSRSLRRHAKRQAAWAAMHERNLSNLPRVEQPETPFPRTVRIVQAAGQEAVEEVVAPIVHIHPEPTDNLDSAS